MILVVGSTGNLGSEICRQLVAGGKSVRGLVRASSAPEMVAYLNDLGVDVVKGDLRDPASLRSACQGVLAVIASTPVLFSRQPGYATPVADPQVHLDLVDAACKAGVEHFIFIGSPDAASDYSQNAARLEIESALIASGMTYTILKTALFMEICLSPAFGFDYPHARAVIYGDGHRNISFISLMDVAQYAVESLSNPAAKNAVFELSARQDYCLLEVVRIFEQASGKHFDLTFIPAVALKAQCQAASDPFQISFSMIMHELASGIQIDSSSARESFNIPLTSVDEYARQVIHTLALRACEENH